MTARSLTPGTRPGHGLLRVVRVAALGGTSMGLATAAHQLGGGTLPGIGELLAVAVVLGLAATLLTARRVRFGVLLAVLGAEQLGLHLVLSASVPAATGCAAGGHLGHTGHGSAWSECLGGSAATMTMGAAGGHAPAMIIGHAAAVLVTAWVLARAESRLWGLAETAVTAATAAAVGPRERRRSSVRPVLPGRPAAAPIIGVASRGPPVLAG